jgi:hydrogenase maturation protein HypF
MAEHGLRGPLVALAWDGTGYGPDGTVWGGEVFSCVDGDVFTRMAHLRPFSLVGGDRAMREPRRSALGVLFEIDPALAAREAELPLTPAPLPQGEREAALLVQLLARGVNCARTTSMGRLFDAVAALCGLPAVISFEGQAAMALEFAADAQCREAYPFPLSESMPAVADWEPAVRRVLADRAAEVPLAIIAARFHNGLAELAVAIARRVGVAAVALSGGCFQNLLLSTRVRERLLAAGLQVYSHRQVPPGDGGLALGQTLVAARRWRGATHVPGHTG